MKLMVTPIWQEELSKLKTLNMCNMCLLTSYARLYIPHHSSFNFQFSKCQHYKSGHDSKFKRRKSHLSTNISKHCINLQTTRGASELPHNLSIYSHWNKTNAGSNVGNKSREIPKIPKKCDPPYYSHKTPLKYGNGSHYWGPLGDVPMTLHLRRGADRIADLFSWCPAHRHGKEGASKEVLGYRGTTYGPYCWWTKSCTTWDLQSPISNGIIIILGSAGFCPSTALPYSIKISSCFHLTHLSALFNQFKEDCWYTN